MRLLVALLIACLPAAAQSCLSSATATVGAHSLRVDGATNVTGTGTKFRLRFGSSVSFGFQDTEATGNASTATRTFNTYSLPASTKVYFAPEVSDNSGVYSTYDACEASLCPSGSGAQPGGYSCEDDGGGSLIPFVTTATDWLELPAPASTNLTRSLSQDRTLPADNGTTINISAGCTDLQAALNRVGDAGDLDPDLNHRIVLPAGMECRAELENSAAGTALTNYTLPAKTGTGTTVVMCGWSSTYQIPFGVQYTPLMRHPSQACSVKVNQDVIDGAGPYGINGALFRPANAIYNTAGSSNGWYFWQLAITAPDWRDFANHQVGVSAVNTSTGEITLAASAAGKLAGQVPVTLALPGITSAAAGTDIYARGHYLPTVSGTSITSVATGWNGSYTSGGVASSPLAYEITCPAGTDPVCTVEGAGHGMIEYNALSITSLASGVLTLGANHGLTSNSDIVIAGNSACDGRYSIASTTSTTATLYGSTCTGTGGTAQRLHNGLFFDLEGDGGPELFGVQSVRFPSATQVQPVGVTLTGTVTAGGWAPNSALVIATLFDFGASKRTTIAQSLIDFPLPWRLLNTVSTQSRGPFGERQDGATVDTWIRASYWLPMSIGRAVDSGGLVKGVQAFVAFSGSTTRDYRVHNATLWDSAGFFWFSDSLDIGPADVEITMSQHIMRSSLWTYQTAASVWHRITWLGRHSIEIKSALRFLVDGFRVRGLPVSGVGNAYAIYLSFWGIDTALSEERKAQDVVFRSIALEDVGAGIGIFHNGAARMRPWAGIERVRLENILINKAPWTVRQGRAIGQTLESVPPFGASNGNAFAFVGPMQAVRLTGFTVRRVEAGNGAGEIGNWLQVSGQRSSGVQIDNGVVEASGPQAIQAYGGSLTPTFTSHNESGWLGYHTLLGAVDPWSWVGTPSAPLGVIPCNTLSSSYDYASTNSYHSSASTLFGCTDCTKWDVDIVTGSADSQSCATREALGINSDFSGKANMPGGFDQAAYKAAMGYELAVTIDGVDGSIDYTVPASLSATACTVDYTTDLAWTSWTRSTDSGSGTSRSVATTGVTSGQRFYYRVFCPDQQQPWDSGRKP